MTVRHHPSGTVLLRPSLSTFSESDLTNWPEHCGRPESLRWVRDRLAKIREPLPPQPGRPRRQDYEYRRGGTRNIFLTCEPLAGWRHLAITERHTMQDFAHQMRWLLDEAYPDAPYGQRGALRYHTPYSSSRSRSVRSTSVITSSNASELGGSSVANQPG